MKRWGYQRDWVLPPDLVNNARIYQDQPGERTQHAKLVQSIGREIGQGDELVFANLKEAANDLDALGRIINKANKCGVKILIVEEAIGTTGEPAPRPGRPISINQSQIDALLALVDKGHSGIAAAKQIGISKSSAHRIIAAHRPNV